MVRALGHSSLVVIIALTLRPSMPALPIYGMSPQSVQYTHLHERKENDEHTQHYEPAFKTQVPHSMVSYELIEHHQSPKNNLRFKSR